MFTWDQYPFITEGRRKRRWFIYLGVYRENPDPFDESGTIMIIAPTTTTQTHYYEPDQPRSKIPHIKFAPEEGFGFVSTCVLDLGSEHIVVREPIFQRAEKDGAIKIRGKLTKSKVKQIYRKLVESPGYSPRSKRQIYENLKNAKVDGLKPPSRRK